MPREDSKDQVQGLSQEGPNIHIVVEHDPRDLTPVTRNRNPTQYVFAINKEMNTDF